METGNGGSFLMDGQDGMEWNGMDGWTGRSVEMEQVWHLSTEAGVRNCGWMDG